VLSGQPVAESGLSSRSVTDLSKIPILLDKEGLATGYSENKVNHLFADGHADRELRLFHRAMIRFDSILQKIPRPAGGG